MAAKSYKMTGSIEFWADKYSTRGFGLFVSKVEAYNIFVGWCFSLDIPTPSAIKFSATLREMGWQEGRKRIEGKHLRVWLHRKVTPHGDPTQ